MTMNLRKVMIELGIPDVERILRIDMDDDPVQALEFVKDVLAKRVKESLQPHWVPVFEASYGPKRKDLWWDRSGLEFHEKTSRTDLHEYKSAEKGRLDSLPASFPSPMQ
jgi:hypothetical protein